MLSAVSQQIQTIQEALKLHQEDNKDTQSIVLFEFLKISLK